MTDKGEVEAFIGWEPPPPWRPRRARRSTTSRSCRRSRTPRVSSSRSAPQFIKDHPDVIERFVRATLRGIEYIRKQPKEKTADILAKKMNDPKAVPVVLNAMGSVILTDPRIDMPSTRIILRRSPSRQDPAGTGQGHRRLGRQVRRLLVPGQGAGLAQEVNRNSALSAPRPCSRAGRAEGRIRRRAGPRCAPGRPGAAGCRGAACPRARSTPSPGSRARR